MSDIIKRESNKNLKNNDISIIYEDIKNKIQDARTKIYKYIDNSVVEIYWYVGKIVNELVGDNTRAEYGKAIIDNLSLKLTKDFGEGFTPDNIRRMKRFYMNFPIWDAVRPELSWSHFRELIKIIRKDEREFYLQESIKSNWGYRELQRQINTKLYDRLAISKDKEYVRGRARIKDEIPSIIKEVGFDFDWSEKDIWKLNYPVEEIDINILKWHFEIPFWNYNNKKYILTPSDILNDKVKYKEEYDRIQNSDLSYPIDIMDNKGRMVILDGLHRLAKYKLTNENKIRVRIIPRAEINNIAKYI